MASQAAIYRASRFFIGFGLIEKILERVDSKINCRALQSRKQNPAAIRPMDPQPKSNSRKLLDYLDKACKILGHLAGLAAAIKAIVATFH